MITKRYMVIGTRRGELTHTIADLQADNLKDSLRGFLLVNGLDKAAVAFAVEVAVGGPSDNGPEPKSVM